MAEKTGSSILPLNGSNYPTWKVQCRMTLMREGVWSIVNGSEVLPGDANETVRAKFKARSNKALATIVLAVDPSLLYLLGDPENPVIVWNKLESQFQKKTWANKLSLRRKLHVLRLKDGESCLFRQIRISSCCLSEELLDTCVVDSGATCNVCNNELTNLTPTKEP